MEEKAFIDIVLSLGLGGIALGALIPLGFALAAALKKSSTNRYAFVASHEIRYFRTSAVILSISAGLLLFSFLSRQLVGVTFQYYFAAFVSLSLAFMLAYGLNQYFKVYYPFYLEKTLKKIRFKPRKSPDGRPLKLLHENEEDVHLTEEMKAQEDAFTYDYDVWYDDVTGYKQIERYAGNLHALVCPHCEFRTLVDYKEEILRQPQAYENGLMQKHYRCSYCGHEEIRRFEIASAAEEKEMTTDAAVID
jgi:hypothetical protein